MTNPDIKTDFANHPNNYDLITEEDGTKHANNGFNQVTLMPDGDTRMFQRRAIKGVGSGHTTFDTCLVAELNGVRVYVKGNQIVMTTRDLKL